MMRASTHNPKPQPVAGEHARKGLPAAEAFATVEILESRLRAAALQGDSLAIEAAGRAYVAAVARAYLARFRGGALTIMGRVRRDIRTIAQSPRA